MMRMMVYSAGIQVLVGMNNDTTFLIFDIMNYMVQEPVALARARFDTLSASVPRCIRHLFESAERRMVLYEN